MYAKHKLRLNSPGRNGQNNRQRRDDQCSCHKCRQCNASPASRELATDNPILTFEITMEAYYQDEDGDADERGAERFANAAEAGGGRGDIDGG